MAAQRHNQRSLPGGNRSVGDDLWTESEIQTLKQAYFADLPRREIDKLLPHKTYAAISMKMHRLGLPSRRAKEKTLEEQTADLGQLLAEDHLQAGYGYLDQNYTDADIAEAYRPPPPLEIEERPCKSCGEITVFRSKFQRWCDRCRRLMHSIA